MMNDTTELLPDVPCGLFHARDDSCLVRVNACLGRLLDTEPTALPGTFLDRAFATPARVLFHTHVVPALELHGRVEGVELTLQTVGGGEEVPVLLSATRDPQADDGAVVRGVLFPLHAHRELQSHLVTAERLLESLPGLVFQLVLHPDGSSSMPYANDAIQEIHGHTAKSVRTSAEPFWNSLHPDDVNVVRAGLRRAAHELTPWHARFRTRPRGETRYIDFRAGPQLLPDGSVLFCGYSHDVTEEVRADELRREKLVAERASEAKTRFLARVNHEMRNPLTAILGFTALLKQYSTELSERLLQMVNGIEVAGNSLLDLVNELLEISRVEAGAEELNLQPVEVAEVVAVASALMQPLASARSISLDVDVPDGLTAVADARRLKQVLLNLISNAIKYNRPRGRVFVRARQQAGRIHLSVRDEGKGLSADELPDLFQPFNRLGMDQSVAGTGLGLVIARTFVEHMGGTIRVSSAPGEGSCFTADLPAHRVNRGASTASGSALIQ